MPSINIKSSQRVSLAANSRLDEKVGEFIGGEFRQRLRIRECVENPGRKTQ